jgi:hypothetical protein
MKKIATAMLQVSLPIPEIITGSESRLFADMLRRRLESAHFWYRQPDHVGLSAGAFAFAKRVI